MGEFCDRRSFVKTERPQGWHGPSASATRRQSLLARRPGQWTGSELAWSASATVAPGCWISSWA
jgi:hypothetical protein